MKINITRTQAILISVFIIIPFSGILGCFAGNALVDYANEYDTWKDLGSPPVKIEHLLSANEATIYVQTIDDRIFSCYRESQYDHDCWNEVDSVPSTSGWEDNPSCYPLDNMPQEPDDVVERLDNRHCIASPVYEGNHWFSYILLPNGSVLQWISEPIGWLGPPGQSKHFLSYLCGGNLIGYLVGSVISLRLFKSRFINIHQDY